MGTEDTQRPSARCDCGSCHLPPDLGHWQHRGTYTLLGKSFNSLYSICVYILLKCVARFGQKSPWMQFLDFWTFSFGFEWILKSPRYELATFPRCHPVFTGRAGGGGHRKWMDGYWSQWSNQLVVQNLTKLLNAKLCHLAYHRCWNNKILTMYDHNGWSWTECSQTHWLWGCFKEPLWTEKMSSETDCRSSNWHSSSTTRSFAESEFVHEPWFTLWAHTAMSQQLGWVAPGGLRKLMADQQWGGFLQKKL